MSDGSESQEGRKPYPRYTIGKEFKFEAAHSLQSIDSRHKCASVHGHSYKVELALSVSDLDQCGWVVDYGEMAGFQAVIDQLDHSNLDARLEVMGLPDLAKSSTTENLARFFYEEADRIFSPSNILVEWAVVREGDNGTWAKFEMVRP